MKAYAVEYRFTTEQLRTDQWTVYAYAMDESFANSISEWLQGPFIECRIVAVEVDL